MGHYGRGCMNRGREHGQGRSSSGSTPTCQLCSKYGYVVADFWHRFNETFRPSSVSSNMHAPPNLTNHVEASTSDTQSITMMAHMHEYSLPKALEKQQWFADSGASHHLTPYAYFLHSKEPYASPNSVCVANGKSLAITCIGIFICHLGKYASFPFSVK